jgi:hypothetical protein
MVTRGIRWAIEQARARLSEADALVDLDEYRRPLGLVALVANPDPKLLEAAQLLDAEIRQRATVQARARRVVGDGG